MEVGAVKQAFNNEIILLKKNLNQAKIQIIHKLTRRAKMLTEKKLPEPQKEKLNRKAESAVKEVLIIKKIKTRDLARFIVTHSGKLNDFINKPIVDNDKACARLLLHKALQEKYKHIREKFSDISIKDLFMSRQERRKLKKEAREKQKNKNKGTNKKGKANAVNVEGEWDVEIAGDKNGTLDGHTDNKMPNNEVGSENEQFVDGDFKSEKRNDNTDDENEISNDEIDDDADESESGDESDSEHSSNESDESEGKVQNSAKSSSLVYKTNNNNNIENNNEASNDKAIAKNKVKLHKQGKNVNSIAGNNKSKDLINFGIDKSKADSSSNLQNENTNNEFSKEDSVKNSKNKKLAKKANSNKNKNLKNKLEKRNFHKETDETHNTVTKMVDPFFITSTGDNYMSLVEPREPDEIKDVHKQGNRQYRRAVMFGHIPKRKPQRKFDPGQNNFKRNSKSEMADTNFNNRKFNQNNRNFDETKGFKRQLDRGNPKEALVPEKLHPSWEAKKKQSGILPFQGKKIVFDES